MALESVWLHPQLRVSAVKPASNLSAARRQNSGQVTLRASEVPFCQVVEVPSTADPKIGR